MKKKLFNRIAAGALSLVMALSLITVGAMAADYTFAPGDVKLAGADATKDKAEIPVGTTFANGYIRVVGTVVQRYDGDKGGVYCVEVKKDQKGALEFTTTGTADVSVSFASTGGSNTSAAGLVNVGTGAVVPNNEGTTTVTGTAATVMSYTALPAGTYQVVSTETDDDNLNRDTRVLGVTITEEGGAAPAAPAGESTTYAFTPGEINLGAQATVDKADIPEGTALAGGFMKTVGEVKQRWQDTKGGVYCVEVEKDQRGAIEFTVTGSANVTVLAASTGGSNSSTVGLVNAATGAVVANKEGVEVVTGTAATTLTYANLPAGTYQVVSTITDDDNMNRGVRIHGVTVNHIAGDGAAAPAPSTPSTPAVAMPADVAESDWFYAAVKNVLDKGAMKGTNLGFEPNTELTIASIYQTLYNMEGANVAAEGAWYAPAITWAAQQGLFTGDVASFTDATAIRGDVMSIMDIYCAQKGITATLFQGDGSGNMMLEKSLTRAEWAQVLTNMGI